MAEVDILEASNYQGSRQSSIFEPPEYELTRAQGHTLQWHPPPDSEELAIALSWHFPMEKTILGKMQAAIKRFLQLERKKPAARGTREGWYASPVYQYQLSELRISGTDPTRNGIISTATGRAEQSPRSTQ